MRTVYGRAAATAAAILTLAAGAAAQDAPSAVLNSLEVRQLVERAEPGDHTRLAAHFAAIGERYTAEAKRHVAMSQGVMADPRRSPAMRAHCQRLAELNRQSATAARELAGYHEKLAGGAPVAPPRGGASFEGGVGAPPPTESQLDALAAAASTPGDHRALGEYFRTLAARYASDADEHARVAQMYRNSRVAQVGSHHDRLAALARDAAREATAASELHTRLAGAPK